MSDITYTKHGDERVYPTLQEDDMASIFVKVQTC